jgi:hypothetical protein
MAARKEPRRKGGAVRSAAASPPISTLVAIRAAQHVGYDRVVFEFDGPVPSEHDVGYVPEILADASGLPVQMFGSAFLSVSFSFSTGHNETDFLTPERTTCGLPNVIQVVRSGDFEGVLSFGIGLAKQQPFTVFTLTNPSRVVIDIAAKFRTILTEIYFVDSPAFAIGVEPYVRAVLRPVLPPSVARRSLEWLFAGPTPAELSGGLNFVSSDATGFSSITIGSNRVARVRLTGGANSQGSTLTIAAEIFPTLRQFQSVDWVKIYDPNGQTQVPNGQSDSIPAGLEP